MKGKFIVIDGPDGCGKTTQVRLLVDYLQRQGTEVLAIRDPGATPIGERIRQILLDPKNYQMTIVTELFLYMASRAQLVAQVIKPALCQGKVVISDRFLDSSIVYQGIAGGIGKKVVAEVGKLATQGIIPDLVIILDISPREGLRRARRLKGRPDRIEKKLLTFHEKVRKGFLQLAQDHPRQYKVIKPAGLREIQTQIRKLVIPLVNGKYGK